MKGLVRGIGLIVFLLFIGYMLDSLKVVPVTAAPPAETVEQKAAKKAEHERWARDVIAVSQLRRSMKNPDSFKLEQALRMPDGTLCVRYRATNSFNATVPGQSVIFFKTRIVSNASGDWNKHCGNKAGEDISYMRRALL